MRGKQQTQEEEHKQVPAQVSHEMGVDSFDGMLCNLGKIGLQAMLGASGLVKQSSILSGADGLACAKQVTSVPRYDQSQAQLAVHAVYYALVIAYHAISDLYLACVAHRNWSSMCKTW